MLKFPFAPFPLSRDQDQLRVRAKPYHPVVQGSPGSPASPGAMTLLLCRHHQLPILGLPKTDKDVEKLAGNISELNSTV